MPAELRPRLHGPPQDHNYSHRRTGDQVYNEHSMPYVRQGIVSPTLLACSSKSDDSSDEENSHSRCKVPPIESNDILLARPENQQVPQKIKKEQGKRKKRRHFACYDFGIPRRRKKRKKIPIMSQIASNVAHTAWNPLTSPASLASQQQTVIIPRQDTDTTCTAQPSGDSSGSSPVKCRSCCASWHGFCGRSPKKSRTGSSEPHRQSQRLVIKNYKLPFEDLPTECKLHIFLFLTPQERGIAARVCSEWCSLMTCSSLWSDLDFSDFDMVTVPPVVSKGNQLALKQHVSPSYSKYLAYKDRMAHFLVYLGDVEPSLQSLQFSYDIGHPKDEWLNYTLTLFKHAKCHNLKNLKFNWMSTPMRPPGETFCCIYNKIRTLYHRHHDRSVVYHLLMSEITHSAPNIETLSMPFDWHPRSVLLLCRLQSLRHLHLTQYLTLRGVSQELIDVVLSHLPHLTHLELQVCVPLYSSRTTFKLSHPKLQTLDLTHAKGFFLRVVHLPQLHVLRVYNHSWRGPLVDNPELRPRCLYDILRKGAPNLVLLNKHRLFGYWLEYLYEELAAHLHRVCPCKTHTSGPVSGI